MAWSALKQLRLIRGAEKAAPPVEPVREELETSVVDAADLIPQPEFQIIDVIDALPWHPERVWSNRQLSQISEVLVHQAAMKNATAESVNKYHITPSEDKDGDGVIESWERNHLSDKGAPHIAYHFVIEEDGTIKQTNKLTSVTWHAKGHNTKAIGILLAGYFNGVGHDDAGADPTDEQIDSLFWLLDYLHLEFPNIKKTNFKGHCEIDPENKAACPGYVAMSALEQWRTN